MLKCSYNILSKISNTNYMRMILISKNIFIVFFLFVFLSGCSVLLKSEGGEETIDQSADEMGKQIENAINQEELDRQADEMGKQIENAINQEELDRQADEMGKQIENAINQEELDRQADEMGKQIENTIKEADNESRTKVMRSCNSISNSSTCIEYVGSFWTEDQKKYHCKEAGVLSVDLCESGNIGGCRIGGDSASDMIVWMYPYGGEPMDADGAKAAKMGCNMNPMGSWQDAR